MMDHVWTSAGVRRWRTEHRMHVTVYGCRRCGTVLEVRDDELAVESAQRGGVDADCDSVIVRSVMGA